jgi:hypothetical protein
VTNQSSSTAVIISPWHFWKNVLGLIIFGCTLAYCGYKLRTSNEPVVLMLSGIGSLVLLLTCIRVIRRLFLIRRILATGGVWNGSLPIRPFVQVHAASRRGLTRV